MKTRIGYLAPEFPGQTHMFLWRERQALAELGVTTDSISTRIPRLVATYTWAAEAQKHTTYLVPISLMDCIHAAIEILRAGPIGWTKCFIAILNAKDTSLVRKLYLVAGIFLAGKLVWLSKTRGWSHVHVPSCAEAANIAMFASMLSKLTYSLALLGPTLEQYGPNQAQKWKHAAFATTVSEKLLKDVQEQLAGSLPERVMVASVGVNLDQVKRQSQYTPWSGVGVCRIYACGRLNPVKGYPYLIETVEILRQQGFDVRLRIAGEDEVVSTGYRRILEKLIQDKSLSEYIELPGALSEEQHRQEIEKAHIFALASLNEGISVAVMEAMAMEVPAVVTNVGGMSELIESGVNAILVEPEQPTQMADAIAKLLQDPAFALKLSQESRKKIAEKFNHQVSAKAIAQHLPELNQQLPNGYRDVPSTVG